MNKHFLIFLLLFSIILSGCQQNESQNINIEDDKLFQNRIEYPYEASNKRRTHILDNMNKIKKGMTKNDVIGLLNLPDEKNLTYKEIKDKPENAIGFSLTYILQRKQKSGSVISMNEKLLRIHFDNDQTLISAYAIRIDNFKEIAE